MRTLGVKLQIARALETAGFTSVEEVAYVPINELFKVRDVPEYRLIEVRKRARDYLLEDASRNQPPPPDGMTDV